MHSEQLLFGVLPNGDKKAYLENIQQNPFKGNALSFSLILMCLVFLCAGIHLNLALVPAPRMLCHTDARDQFKLCVCGQSASEASSLPSIAHVSPLTQLMNLVFFSTHSHSHLSGEFPQTSTHPLFSALSSFAPTFHSDGLTSETLRLIWKHSFPFMFLLTIRDGESQKDMTAQHPAPWEFTTP